MEGAVWKWSIKNYLTAMKKGLLAVQFEFGSVILSLGTASLAEMASCIYVWHVIRRAKFDGIQKVGGDSGGSSRQMLEMIPTETNFSSCIFVPSSHACNTKLRDCKLRDSQCCGNPLSSSPVLCDKPLRRSCCPHRLGKVLGSG
jgi:hypothetical protein